MARRSVPPQMRNRDSLPTYPLAKHTSNLSLAPWLPHTATTDRDQIKHPLNASAERPDNLTFIVLFNDAKKHWYRYNIVYAETDFRLLRGYEPSNVNERDGETTKTVGASDSDTYSVSVLIDLRSPAVSAASLGVEVSSSSTSRSRLTLSEQARQGACEFPVGTQPASPILDELSPIAVFSQVLPLRNRRTFEFVGWHAIDEVEFFEPNTPELKDMLRQRGPRGWVQLGNISGSESKLAKTKRPRKSRVN